MASHPAPASTALDVPVVAEPGQENALRRGLPFQPVAREGSR